jgi:hypothetical protein
MKKQPMYGVFHTHNGAVEVVKTLASKEGARDYIRFNDHKYNGHLTVRSITHILSQASHEEAKERI